MTARPFAPTPTRSARVGKRGLAEQGVGRSRGGWGSTRPLTTERRGKPLVVAGTPGQRPVRPQASPLLERTTDRMWPEAVTGDRGDRTAKGRDWRGCRAIATVIPTRSHELGPDDYDPDRYRKRPIIEQTITRRTRFRRVATRVEPLDATYLTMGTIAMILQWL